jgi:FkbM family methyltransferase
MRMLRRARAVLAEVGQLDRARSGTFIDVGANIGTSVIAASTEIAYSKAVAFEPNPDPFRLLCLNVFANQLQDVVRTLAVAVSDTNRVVDLEIHERRSGRGRIVPAARPTADADVEGRHYVTVECVTLDSMVERGLITDLPAGLLWIDAQGHEGHVLRGARRLLEPGIPVIFEVSPAGLRKQEGGLEALVEAARSYYSNLVPLRKVRSLRKHVQFEAKPIADLPKLLAPSGEWGTGVSDAMLLRL